MFKIPTVSFGFASLLSDRIGEVGERFLRLNLLRFLGSGVNSFGFHGGWCYGQAVTEERPLTRITSLSFV